jgi:hypothetical protein
LAARLGADPPLAKLTRPNASPVWVKRSAVSEIRLPLGTEQQAGGGVRAMIVIGDLHQAVREDVQTAMSIVNPPAANV